ncbi:MAG: hypothetical protein R6U95_10505 [Bacteroidales bacterium]
MKRIIISALLVCISSITISVFAQSACVEYHLNCANTEDNGYSTAEGSRSALLLKGQTSEFRFTIYEGKDYKFSICGEESLGEHLQYQLIDWETNEVLYDNKDHNYVNSFEFTVLITKTIRVEVTVPTKESESETNSNSLRPKSTSMGCVGVLIEEMITPKKGF